MDREMITKELTKFNVTDAAIAQMGQEYMALTIKGLDDTAGFKAVHAARMDVKKRRVEVVKCGKELREDAVFFQRAVLAEEKRILALIAPIEDHLQSEEDKIEAEKERIRKEAEEKEKARIQARIDRLEDLGMVLSKGFFILPFDEERNHIASVEVVKIVTDDQFESFVQGVTEAVSAENGRRQKEEADRKAEEERLAKVRAEQEEERLRLAEEGRKNAEARKRLNDEQARIEAEKKALAEAKQKEIDDRLLAAEKARIEAEEKAKREAEEAERRRLTAEVEARIQEELKPDKRKLLELADGIEAIHGPTTLKFDASKKVLEETLVSLKGVAKALRESVKKMKGGK